MELDSDHADSRCAAVARVMEEIAAHSDSSVVGVLLLRMIISTDWHVREIVFAVVWNVLAVDKNDSVGRSNLTALQTAWRKKSTGKALSLIAFSLSAKR
jgi:hypothetical protein